MITVWLTIGLLRWYFHAEWQAGWAVQVATCEPVWIVRDFGRFIDCRLMLPWMQKCVLMVQQLIAESSKEDSSEEEFNLKLKALKKSDYDSPLFCS